MKTSKEGLIFIASLEGLATQLYLDSVNVLTIGIGATVSEIPDIKSKPWSYTITIQEAVVLFQKSLVKYENAVNRALKVDITQQQFNALVSICYNIGTGGLSISTFIKRINTKDSAQRVYDAILMWNKPREIVGRRTKEAKLFRYQTYPDSMQVNHFPISATSHKPIYSKGKLINLYDYLT